MAQGPDGELLASVARACDEAAGDPARLARALRVVVPSGALREHLAAALVAESARARLGVRIDTLDAVVRDVLARCGETPAPDLLTPLAVAEWARREPALSRELDGLDDGYAGVVASVDDLLDAGFTAAHAEALAEPLAEATQGALRERSAALVRIAARVSSGLDDGLGHRSARLARANTLLRDAGARATEHGGPLPSRGIWVVGFADATGVQLDLLETLAHGCGAQVWLDAAAPGSPFGARLRERLEATGRVRVRAAAPAPALVAARYADPEAEARAAAGWARERLAEGVTPERIAIIARDLAPHRLALRRQLRRHGVPFSGEGERGAAGPAARRIGALLELIESGRALSAERWLEALAPDPDFHDLRDALHVAGVATLGDLADPKLRPFADETRLVARTGLSLDPAGSPVAPGRRVPGARLVALAERARAVLAELASAPPRAELAECAARLSALVDALGWTAQTPGRAELASRLAETERAGATPVPISREDWPRLLRRVLGDVGWDPLGGCGGGVQLLSVMEARGCRFEALRAIGLVRGAFPRRLAEDPLLPDAVRRALRVVLPDLPVKAEGHEEERFLFSQLLAAAPRVWLSCAASDAQGRAAVASPLFERASAAPGDAEDAAAASPRDAWLDDALRRGRAAYADALPAALRAGHRAAGVAEGDVDAVARARVAVLGELDPRNPRRAEAGPYLGWVGAPRSAADPRRRPPAVSDLEGAARCPWQHFLKKILRLAPPPDVFRALPAARDSRLLGNVVHRALEFLCDPERADSPWPNAAPAETILAAARSVARDEGLALPGYAHALAGLASAYVEVARRLDREEGPTLLGVETDRAVEIEGPDGPRALRFRADRVEDLHGTQRFTDWKAGRPKVDSQRASTRAVQYERCLARGDLLQGHAYALTGARARYVYLAPEIDDARRVLEVDPDGPERAAFEASVAVLLGAREAGAFPPRLRAPDRDDEPGACRSCDVKQACLRGDSGARRRLGAWADAAGEHAAGIDRAALAVWRLPESAT